MTTQNEYLYERAMVLAHAARLVKSDPMALVAAAHLTVHALVEIWGEEFLRHSLHLTLAGCKCVRCNTRLNLAAQRN